MSRLALIGALLLCAPTAATAEPPLPTPAGWKSVAPEQRFDRSNVFEAINGAAEQYHAYGFQGLRIRTYRRKGGLEVTVHVFDQAEPINAFGIFHQLRSPAAVDLRVGSQGAALLPHRCSAFVGRHFIETKSVDGKLTKEACIGLLGGLARALPGPATLPPEAGLLPAERRAPGTLRYARSGYLGTRDLGRCLHARYLNAAGRPAHTLIVMSPPPGRTSSEQWKALVAGKRWSAGTLEGLQLLTRTIPYRGVVMFARGKDRLVGVTGTGTPAELAKVLRRAFGL